jgi:hypothetical protein
MVSSYFKGLGVMQMSGTPLASLGICRFANLQYRLAFKFEREFSLSFLNSVVQRTAHSKVRLGAVLAFSGELLLWSQT